MQSAKLPVHNVDTSHIWSKPYVDTIKCSGRSLFQQ